jgi:type I site-specific restriction endonuclease
MAPAGSKNAPEARARDMIDRLLEDAGWVVQDRDDMNLSVPAVGVCEAKPAGVPVRNVEVQAKRYVEGLPDELCKIDKYWRTP